MDRRQGEVLVPGGELSSFLSLDLLEGKEKRNFAAVKLFRFILKVFDPVGHNIAAREMRSSRNYMESLFSERKNQSCIYARG